MVVLYIYGYSIFFPFIWLNLSFFSYRRISFWGGSSLNIHCRTSCLILRSHILTYRENRFITCRVSKIPLVFLDSADSLVPPCILSRYLYSVTLNLHVLRDPIPALIPLNVTPYPGYCYSSIPARAPQSDNL